MPETPDRKPSRARVWIIIAVIIPLLLAYGIYYVNYVGPEWANRMHCANGVQHIALAIRMYAQTYGSIPPAYTMHRSGRRLHSWRTLILPYLYLEDVYNQVRLDEPWDSPHNRKVFQKTRAPLYYHCFDATNPENETSFVMVVGPNTISDGPHSVRFGDIKDGLSNTILFVEVKNSGIQWAEPRDLDYANMSFRINDPNAKGISSDHPGGALAAFADTSIHFIGDDVDPKIVKALTTTNGGEDVRGYTNR
jgi:hypothetical protein